MKEATEVQLGHHHQTPILIVISGPSGVGKDALLNQMRLSDPHLHYAVTATTRSIRNNERDGVDYIFLDSDLFQDMKQRGEFLESAEVYGNWYGVPKGQIADAISQGKDVVIKTDVQGAATIKRLVPQALLIFVVPPSMDELERRLRKRLTESKKSLKLRLETAQQEMNRLPEFDYAVINDTLKEAIHLINSIVIAEKCRVIQ